MDLDHLLAQGKLIPAPDAPLFLSPSVYADETVPGVPGRVVDARALGRGEHPVHRWWLHPETCQLVGGEFPWGPPPPPEESRLDETGGALRPSWRARALLVTGPDVGAASDAELWLEALDALGVGARRLHRPTRQRLEEAITQELCAEQLEDTSAILITAGRASPAEGGAFLLGSEAISYRRLAQLLADSCGQAGLLVWVLDAAWAGGLDVAPAASQLPPTILWRASDAARTDAPRLEPEAGGLLSAALAPAVTSRAVAMCLGERASPDAPDDARMVHPTPDEIAGAFAATGVTERMWALRWEHVGQPALEAATIDPASDPIAAAELALALLDDLAGTPYRSWGELPEGARCGEAEHCQDELGHCPMPECHRWECAAGRCVLGEDLDAPCDDGNPCTDGDRCLPGAVCGGDLRACEDDNPCTLDACDFALDCVHLPAAPGVPCDDGSVCSQDDQCDGGGKCVGTDIDCDDDNVCTLDTCDPDSGCDNDPVDQPCDDDDPCTHQDYCDNDGNCVGLAKPCYDGDPCTLDECDSLAGGVCVFPLAPDGTPCDDAELCTVADACAGGVCKGQPLPCDDGYDCTLDYCQSGLCGHLPVPGTCATDWGCADVGESPPDNPCLLCQATDHVVALDGAACEDDGIGCTEDFCFDGVCVHPNADGTCHRPDGTCVAVGEPLLPCLVCAATGVGAAVEPGTACDDGDPCSVDDHCSDSGSCQSTPLGCCPAAAPLECDAEIQGDNAGPQASHAIDTWSCLPAATYPGPESAHPFVAPCSGSIYIATSKSSPAVILLVRGDIDVCAAGQCENISVGGIAAPITEGEELVVVVDGSEDSAGPYTLTTTCYCSP